MSASAVAVCGTFLPLRARRAPTLLLAAVVPLLLASAPWWVRLLGDRWATRAVSVSDRDETLGQHLAQVLPALHRPIGGLLGTHAADAMPRRHRRCSELAAARFWSTASSRARRAGA
jgi:hypothetical protein